MRALPLLIALTVVPAGAAQAAVVELGGTGREVTLRVSAAPGERNSMTIFGTSIGGTMYAEVRDVSAPPVPGSGCELVEPQTVRCATERIDDAVVDVGDRDDVVEELGGFVSSQLRGGSGDDRLTVTGRGALDGGSGSDRLTGADAPDSMDGGPGDDRLDGRDGDDTLGGGADDDLIYGGPGSDSLHGVGDTTVTRPGSDRMFGGPGRDHLDDNDDVPGGIGPDVADGGNGRDIVFSYYARSRNGVRVDLGRPGGDGAKGEGDSVVRVEELWGSRGDDVLRGTSARNEIEGHDGNDVIDGRGGPDRLRVNEGDRVSGGDGADTIEGLFRFTDGSVRCGAGHDVVSPYFGPLYENDRVATWRGPVVDSSCEVLQSGATLRVDPVPVARTSRGLLTLRLLRFRCCEQSFALTRASRPFRTFDSTRLRKSRVKLRLPRGTARAARRGPITVRAIAKDNLVWRFRVRLPR